MKKKISFLIKTYLNINMINIEYFINFEFLKINDFFHQSNSQKLKLNKVSFNK
jgi:hypothetical protein